MAQPSINGGTLKTSLTSMSIGDYISCEYTATTNAAGTFANLGSATKAEISTSGTPTPDGTFYFIKVDKGLLIADRTIQTGITWGNLNSTANKYTQGKVVSLGGSEVKLRFPTGGVTFADEYNFSSSLNRSNGCFPVNNEWDKYIIKSTLKGKITAGSNSVWNLGIPTFTQDTPVTVSGISDSTSRTIRGVSSCIKITTSNQYVTPTTQFTAAYNANHSFEATISTTSTAANRLFTNLQPAMTILGSYGVSRYAFLGVTGGKVQFSYNNTSNVYQTITGNINVNDGLEHHIAVTISGTTTRTVKIYVDGVLDISSTGLTGAHATSGETYINKIGTGSSYASGFFVGTIREVRMWARELSATDVANYAFKQVASTEPNLTIYYKMNEITGTTFANSGASANNGTVTGSILSTVTNSKGLIPSPITTTQGFRPVLEYQE